MATAKIKFRASVKEGKEGTIYCQITHERVITQIGTSFKLYPHEWNASRAKVVYDTSDHNRKSYLQRINLYARFDLNRLLCIVLLLDTHGWGYGVEDIVAHFEQMIVDKYRSDNDYILPIITDPNSNARIQYQNKKNKINIQLKEVARRAEITTPLTTYVARHSWASIAKSNNIPISAISQGMGHSNEMTTQIYLSSLDSTVVDNANSKILKLLR